jgi:hypothetical protein
MNVVKDTLVGVPKLSTIEGIIRSTCPPHESKVMAGVIMDSQMGLPHAKMPKIESTPMHTKREMGMGGGYFGRYF